MRAKPALVTTSSTSSVHNTPTLTDILSKPRRMLTSSDLTRDVEVSATTKKKSSRTHRRGGSGSIEQVQSIMKHMEERLNPGVTSLVSGFSEEEKTPAIAAKIEQVNKDHLVEPLDFRYVEKSTCSSLMFGELSEEAFPDIKNQAETGIHVAKRVMSFSNKFAKLQGYPGVTSLVSGFSEEEKTPAIAAKIEQVNKDHLVEPLDFRYVEKSTCSSLMFGELSEEAFPDIKNQAETGIHVAKRVMSFSNKFAKLQEFYSQELAKIVALERKKVSAWKTADEMETVWAAYLGLIDRVGEIAAVHEQVSQSILMRVVKPLDVCTEETTAKLTDAVVREKNFRDSFVGLKSTIEKSKSKTLRVIDSANLDAADTPKTSLFAKTMMPKSAKNQLKSVETAYEAASSHKQAIEKANTFVQNFKSREMPAILNQIQIAEENRVRAIKIHLQEFSNSLTPLTRTYTRVAENNQQSADRIDLDAELTTYVKKLKIKEKTNAVQEFGYDLVVSPEEIQGKKKKIRATSVLGGSMLFNLSLNDLMDFQSEDNPDAKVPKLFEQLMIAFHKLKGCETEGIFRIACDTNEMNLVIAHLESENYDCLEQVKSPHVISNVLKKWLRELKEPVFPYQYYPQYCTMAHSSVDEAALVGLLESFPLVNRLIIVDLLAVLRMTSQNGSVTKMNLENLGICITPGLVRHPNKAEMGMEEMFRSNQIERMFVEKIMAVELSPASLAKLTMSSSSQLQLAATTRASMTLRGIPSGAAGVASEDEKTPAK
eukprot:TRINITY_DN7029_c0_g1_i1.p1 TRINITY_DN7029_c0_g1~~TRINITY_DN7029_c0_g1_i1.p1  ORF type:complete len:884 (-),score=242.41 TRINITY_DN7029_c0_g1_i1:63-2363(-)